MNLAADIFKALSQKPRDELRDYLGASSIGRECERAIYYDYHNAPSLDFDPKIKIAFSVGKQLEHLLLTELEAAGYQVIYPSPSNGMLGFVDLTNPKFRGHADALLIINHKQYILEIKTAKSSRFQVFVKSGLRAFSEVYYAQLQSYMGMSGIHRSVLLAMNKDTHDLHCQWVDFDEEYYKKLQSRAAYIINAEEPPQRINQSPFYDACSRCNFRDTCFFNNSTRASRSTRDASLTAPVDKAIDDEGIHF